MKSCRVPACSHHRLSHNHFTYVLDSWNVTDSRGNHILKLFCGCIYSKAEALVSGQTKVGRKCGNMSRVRVLLPGSFFDEREFFYVADVQALHFHQRATLLQRPSFCQDQRAGWGTFGKCFSPLRQNLQSAECSVQWQWHIPEGDFGY